MSAVIDKALKELIEDKLVEKVDGTDNYRLTFKGRMLAEAFGGCPQCPHCIATAGTLASNDPALTTNKATTSRPCRDCGGKGREASKSRSDVCLRCMRVRARVIAGVKDKTVSPEQFAAYQKPGLRFQRLAKLGLASLTKETA